MVHPDCPRDAQQSLHWDCGIPQLTETTHLPSSCCLQLPEAEGFPGQEILAQIQPLMWPLASLCKGAGMQGGCRMQPSPWSRHLLTTEKSQK